MPRQYSGRGGRAMNRVLNRVFIDGEAGTTGLGIRARLGALPGVALISLPDADRKSEGARRAAMRDCDVTILCLPDDAAREAVAIAQSLGPAAPRLLDASSAHRTAPGWVYGFAEIAAGRPAAIAAAARVANPGCYATGAIALLKPLVEAGLLAADAAIAINAVSGYSGGGRAMIAAHRQAGGPAFELYALALAHKHVPEIMAQAGLAAEPVFVPSVGHFRQGMLVAIPLFLDRLPGRPTAPDILAAYRAHYAGAAGIGIAAAPATLDPQALNDTDRLEIFVAANGPRAVLIARLDNLGKGAAGAAVQNLALMLGLPAPPHEQEPPDA
jgi:N-acetyl-gamma-glutamyl-phosphate reductase